MSTHNLPKSTVFGPKVLGGPKHSGFLYGDEDDDIPRIDMSHEHHTTNQKLDDDKPEKFIYIIKLLLTTFLPLIVSIFLLVHFLRPSSPQFTLTDATVHAFNFSMQYSLLSSQMQVTISSQNPNKRFGVAYENLNAYASYKSQQITFSTSIPDSFLGHNVDDVWSPYLSGIDVPVAPYFGEELEKDEKDGFLFLTVGIDGKIKYKLWFFSFGDRLSVNCPAYFSFRRDVLPVSGDVVRFQQTSTCNVDA